MAAAPEGTSFNQWEVEEGAISATCPLGFACEVSVESNGMYQDVVTSEIDPSKSFVRTILTDANATGNPELGNVRFSGENFIASGTESGTEENSGIASLSVMSDGSIGDFISVAPEFYSSETEISTGWAGDEVSIHQKLESNWGWFGGGRGLDGVKSEFALTQSGLNGENGKHMGIIQEVGAPYTITQKLAVIEKTGIYSTGTDDIVNINPKNETLHWEVGESSRAVWMGQDISAMGLYTEFVKYENNSTGESTSATNITTLPQSSRPLAPAQWDDTYWIPPGFDTYNPVID